MNEPEATRSVRADQLEEARQALQQHLEQAIAAYETTANTGQPLELDVTFSEGKINAPEVDSHDAIEPADLSLEERIRAHVHVFHQHPAVQQSGVRVLKVTAIDSDADGHPAVDVKYEYAARNL